MAQVTDAELDRIQEAAWALQPSQRDAFEQQCIVELLKLPLAARGEGSLHRTIAMVQRPFLGLAIGGTGNLSKYGRAFLRPKGQS